MTCYCVCNLLEEFKIDPNNTYVDVSDVAASLSGTSARLHAGDLISINDLLYGMMLPSGNDAAYCLAESFGAYLHVRSEEYRKQLLECSAYGWLQNKQVVGRFLDYMNQTAVALGLRDSNYANPHGLCNQLNKSTAADISKLTAMAMKNSTFRKIVRQDRYSCMISQHDGTQRTITWENTNKLLPNGWQGVKTGVTTAAGPCFDGFVEVEGTRYIVVILGCTSMEARWNECKKLASWAHESAKQKG